MGERSIWMLPDKWAIVTRDGKCAAHFEHTVVVRPVMLRNLSTFEEIENKKE
jgi:methionyl aminopeptidase